MHASVNHFSLARSARPRHHNQLLQAWRLSSCVTNRWKMQWVSSGNAVPSADTLPQLACLPPLEAKQLAAESPAAASRMRYLAADEGPSALDGISTLVLDCDGVLWRGTHLLPHTVAALEAFRARGLRLLFLTNNSSKSRKQYTHKFAALGISVTCEEVVPTSFTAAAYLQQTGFRRKAFVVGNEGLQAELQAAGIEYVTWHDVCERSGIHQRWTAEGFEGMELDPDIGAVVVGWDPEFCYSRLCYASACLLELPDCLFVGTNRDQADKMRNGRKMPGTGCSILALEAATGRKAHDVGKGGDWLLPFLCEQYGVQPEQACIVGDRLDTDIAIGKQGGLRTVLPLTGVTTEATLATASPDHLPDYVVPCLATLAGIT